MSGIAFDILLKVNKTFNCVVCTLDKQHKTPINKAPAECAKKVLEFIHTDVCGPVQVKSIGGAYYTICFIDDYCRFGAIYFMKTKDEAESKLADYIAWAELQTGKRVKRIRCDRGGEYSS